jgi:DNA primase
MCLLIKRIKEEVIDMAKKENWVDYKTIKEQVSMQMVLDKYGIKLKESGKNHVCCCPIHNGTNFRQFSVNLEKSIWQCFGDCKTGGNVLDFTAMMEFGSKEPSSIRQAALKLKKWFILDSSIEESSAEVPTADEEKDLELTLEPAEDEERKINKPLKFELKNLDPDHEWFQTRGILPEIVKYFGLGLQKKGKAIPNRIAIPIHNDLGQMVAYCGRAVDKNQIRKEGKYKLPANFSKSEIVYNLNRQPKKAKALILVESYISVWKLHQMGISCAVAIMGSQLSIQQEKLITGFLGPHKRIVCMFDADEAGKKCAEDCLNRLSQTLYVKVADIGQYAKKPHQLTSENLHACLCIKK